MRSAMSILLTLVVVACTTSRVDSQPEPRSVRVITADVERFYDLWDRTEGRPSAAQIQKEYIDPGSAGLQGFIPARIVSSEALAKHIAENPGLYEKARSCIDLLPDLRRDIDADAARFREIYPEMSEADVTFVIGRGNSAGTVSDAGVIIGLDRACGVAPLGFESIHDRLRHVIAHELVHTQQTEFEQNSLLAYSLNEGIADFVGELISGSTSNPHLVEWTRGREEIFERRFREAMLAEDVELRDWLYGGVGTAEEPGDLGYWVGYRIARAFYDAASDKSEAIRVLLASGDADRILRESAW